MDANQCVLEQFARSSLDSARCDAPFAPVAIYVRRRGSDLPDHDGQMLGQIDRLAIPLKDKVKSVRLDMRHPLRIAVEVPNFVAYTTAV